MENRKIQLFIIIALTILVYSNTLFNGLVWDDHAFLEKWPAIQSWNGIVDVFKGSAPEGQGNLYRPLRGVFYTIDYQLWGANPFFYHLQALLIHLGCTVLVYLIIDVILRSKVTKDLSTSLRHNNVTETSSEILRSRSRPQNDRWLPFVVALLFGLHPIHTETISYISASMESIGSLFYLAAFYFFLKGKLGWSGILGGLGFFSYEMTLTLPLVMGLYLLVLKKAKIGQVFRTTWSFFALAAAFLFIRIFLLGILSRNAYLGYSFYLTMLTMAKVFVRYIGLLILPIGQNISHTLAGDFPTSMLPYDSLQPILQQSILDPAVILSVGILVGLGVVGWLMRKRQPLLSFGIGWFFITLLPVSQIIPGGGVFQEKFLYIPSVGFLLVVAWLICHPRFNLGSSRSGFRLKAGMTILFLITMIFGFLTFQRNQIWHDDISLWESVVSQDPRNLLANYNLGLYYSQKGDYQAAEKHYLTAIQKAPRFIEARYNLGNVYGKIGEASKSAEQYQIVNEIQPGFGGINDDPLKNLSYPKDWTVTKKDQTIVLEDPKTHFRIELTQGNSNQTYGKLINQGLAQIPNFDKAEVKIWQDGDIKKNQFFLYRDGQVLTVLVYPADSKEMSVFDKIITSL